MFYIVCLKMSVECVHSRDACECRNLTKSIKIVMITGDPRILYSVECYKCY